MEGEGHNSVQWLNRKNKCYWPGQSCLSQSAIQTNNFINLQGIDTDERRVALYKKTRDVSVARSKEDESWWVLTMNNQKS